MACRATGYRTTWKLRLFAASSLFVLALGSATHAWWSPTVGWFLVSDTGMVNTDLILIDNLDTNYLLFEKARNLKKSGMDARVVVPVAGAANDPEKPNLVSREIAEVLIRVAGLDAVEIIPIRHIEPITLNAARQLSDRLEGSNIKTVLILTSGFKSKRLYLVFQQVLAEIGIDAYCLPVWGAHRPDNWMESWHGIEEVLMQSLKLAYYRLWVLKGRDT